MGIRFGEVGTGPGALETTSAASRSSLVWGSPMLFAPPVPETPARAFFDGGGAEEDLRSAAVRAANGSGSSSSTDTTQNPNMII